MLVGLVGGLVMVALDSRFVAGALRALDLAVGPRVRRFGQAVRHAVFPANAVNAVPTRQKLVRLGRKRHPVVRQECMPFTGQLVEHAPQKFGRDDPLGVRVEFGKGHFAGAVNGPEEARLAFFGPPFREIDAQVAGGMVLAFLFRGALPVFARRQATDAVALEAAGQRGAG